MKAGSATSPSACPSSTSTRSGPAAVPSPSPTGEAQRLRPAERRRRSRPGLLRQGRSSRRTVLRQPLPGPPGPEVFLGGRMKILPERSLARRFAAGARDRQGLGRGDRSRHRGHRQRQHGKSHPRYLRRARHRSPRLRPLLLRRAGGMHAVEMAAHLGMPTVIGAAQCRRLVGLRSARIRSRQGLHPVAHAHGRPDQPVAARGGVPGS